MLTLKEMTKAEYRELTEHLGCSYGFIPIEERERDYKLLCETCYVFVPYYGANLHRLQLFKWNEEEKRYDMDSSGYLFFNHESKEYLFTTYEDDIFRALGLYHNIAFGERISKSKIQKMGFVFKADDGGMVKEYVKLDEECQKEDF